MRRELESKEEHESGSEKTESKISEEWDSSEGSY